VVIVQFVVVLLIAFVKKVINIILVFAMRHYTDATYVMVLCLLIHTSVVS